MYSDKMVREWEAIKCKGSFAGDGQLIFPRPVIANATLKEIQVSKGQNSKMMGLKSKKTHFKLDTNMGKVGLMEILPLQLKDTNITLRGYTHTVEMMGYFTNNTKKR